MEFGGAWDWGFGGVISFPRILSQVEIRSFLEV
jgi:hypothetical protein